jgi:nucleoside-triphosphatase THEP1
MAAASLASVHAAIMAEADEAIAAFAHEARAAGLVVTGVINAAPPTGCRHRCDTDLIDLATGQRHVIAQAGAKSLSGCRLDPGAIEHLAGRLMRHVQDEDAHPVPDVLVINRFGRMEAGGRGFRPVIAQAIQRGIPVVTGVNAINQAAFNAFADGLDARLEPNSECILSWLRNHGVNSPETPPPEASTIGLMRQSSLPAIRRRISQPEKTLGNSAQTTPLACPKS